MSQRDGRGPVAHTVCWSASGEWLAAASRGGATLVQVSSGQRRALDLAAGSELGFSRERLLALAGSTVRAVALAEPLDEEPLPLAASEAASFCATVWGRELVLSSPAQHRIAIGNRSLRIERTGGDELLAVFPEQTAVLAGKHGVLLAQPNGARTRLAIPGEVSHVDLLWGGRAAAILASEGTVAVCTIISRTGDVIRRISLPRPTGWSVAASSALALALHQAGELSAIDLRAGSVAWTGASAAPWVALALDPSGASIAALARDSEQLEVHAVAALARAPARSRSTGASETRHEVEEAEPPPRRDHGPDEDGGAGEEDTASAESAVAASTESAVAASAESAVAASTAPPQAQPAPPPPPTMSALPWLARRRVRSLPVPGVTPYESAAAHLDAVLALCRARAHLAIANEWSLGRLAFRVNEAVPFQSEVAVLARGASPPPTPATTEIQRQVASLYADLIRRTSATLTSGVALPLVDLADELRLAPAEVHVLATIAAPGLCPAIARLYAIAANNSSRPGCDRALVRALLGAELGEASLLRLLAPTAPLVRLGLVELHPAANWQFEALTVRPSLLLRLLGEPAAVVAGNTATVRAAAIELERFRGPRHELERWFAALQENPSGRRDVRFLVQGAAGSGRRTLLDAVAARAGRRCGFIDATQLAARGAGALAALRDAIHDVAISGLVPCVVEPEALAADAPTATAVRELLRAHPGPLAIATGPGGALPLEPGAIAVTLLAPTASERLAAWIDAAARFGLVAEELSPLATRLPVGMATIERVCRETAASLAGEDRDCSTELDVRCRQKLEHRLGKLATRVGRKASRAELILPRELLEAIDELIAGVRLRHIVHDGWGFGQQSSLRGLTALFYGPPGTGKSMVAGVIAAELGLELYRVDLSAVTSKWLGETEKHLSELFDAAEGGELILLFDEADALFTKRTEVETSHDRYANLGTSYLLQRLDDFTGIALLTSNSESSIDDAFKRRLSFRLQFPFPEADMRARLWEAHLPAAAPRAPDLDFPTLAERFQLSGGNIRNCLLRAAFLAAREGAPLDQGRLLRTVESEYLEMGHISTTGRLI